MHPKRLIVFLFAPLLLSACASQGILSSQNVLAVGSGVVQATTLDENSVKQTASLAAKELDSQNQVAPSSSNYSVRLEKLTRGLQNLDGMNLNFKVYLSEEMNAFAMADGTVRVYSALMDAMPDDQVLAVIGHEIGHVKLKHSYNQMREQLLTDTAFSAVASAGGIIGTLTTSQLGQIGHAAVNAHFSKKDELEADAYAVKALKRLGKDPYAMKRSIETLESIHSSEGGFLSSHPSNKDRIAHIQSAIDKS